MQAQPQRTVGRVKGRSPVDAVVRPHGKHVVTSVRAPDEHAGIVRFCRHVAERSVRRREDVRGVRSVGRIYFLPYYYSYYYYYIHVM